MRNRTNLVVVSRAENAAYQNLIGTHLALGRLVKLHHIVIHLLLIHRRRILCSVGAQHDDKMSLCFETQVALDHVLQTPVECGVVCVLDGLDVGV